MSKVVLEVPKGTAVEVREVEQPCEDCKAEVPNEEEEKKEEEN